MLNKKLNIIIISIFMIFGISSPLLAQDKFIPSLSLKSIWWSPEYHEGHLQVQQGREKVREGREDIMRGHLKEGEKKILEGEYLKAWGYEEMAEARQYGYEHHRPWRH